MNCVIKKILSLGLTFALFIGISVAVGGVSGVSAQATASVDASYYAGISATEGTELLGQVHDLITTTHSYYTTYVDCKTISYVSKTDKGVGTDMLRDFYTQQDISSTWVATVAGTWNREHVWCQSLSGGLWGTDGGGSDLHHLRPSEVKLNATRGNNKFGKTTNGTAAYYIDKNGKNLYVGGYISGTTFEPLDKVKGDVARIVLYVYTHYNTYSNVGGTTNGKGTSSFFGKLSFTQIMTASSEAAAIEMLLQWNKADPVDEIETTRNDAVYAIQGNRNPFIDHPEYADAIWGDTPLGSENEGGNTGGGNENEGGNTGGGNENEGGNTGSGNENEGGNTGSGNENEGGNTGSGNENEGGNTGSGNENEGGSTGGGNENEGGNTGGGTVTDSKNLTAFHEAVAKISSASSLSARLEAINAALTAYNKLSDAETGSAASDILALLTAISDYNRDILILNTAANGAGNAALSGLGFTRV